MFVVIGSARRCRRSSAGHADWPAKEPYVRARVQVENGYPTFHTITQGDQLLVTSANGVTHKVDENGMRIERQPADSGVDAPLNP